MTSLSDILDIDNTLVKEAAAVSPARKYRILREDDRDLTFRGHKVAVGRCGDRQNEIDWTRWTVVVLYITVGGSFVVAIERHTRWQGQSDRYDATVHATFAEVRRFLTADNEGRLGPASKAMIEDAVAALPSLAGEDVEQID